MLALEVKRLRDILAAHADEVFSLENRKAQLALSMEERKQEVEVHRWGGRVPGCRGGGVGGVGGILGGGGRQRPAGA